MKSESLYNSRSMFCFCFYDWESEMQKLFQEEYVDTHQFYPYLDIRSLLEPDNADGVWTTTSLQVGKNRVGINHNFLLWSDDLAEWQLQFVTKVTKAKPDDVEPDDVERPSKEKIKELIENGILKKGWTLLPFLEKITRIYNKSWFITRVLNIFLKWLECLDTHSKWL